MKPEDILTKYMQLRLDTPMPEDPRVRIQTPFGVIHARQAVDRRQVVVERVEHRVTAVTDTCGKVHRGTFPADVSAPVHYGSRRKAASADLTQWQLLPLCRSTDVLGHLFGTPGSAATAMGAIAQARPLLTPAGEAIKQGLLDSKVVCFAKQGRNILHTITLAFQGTPPHLLPSG